VIYGTAGMRQTLSSWTKRMDKRLRAALWLLGGLLVFDFGSLALHLIFSSHPQLGDLFDLDKEGNLPTWYSSFKFTCAAFAAVFCYRSESDVVGEQVYKYRWLWLAVAVLMLGMSAEETAQIHETVVGWFMSSQEGARLREAFQVGKPGGSLLWGVLFAPVLIIIAALLGSFYIVRLKSYRPLLFGGILAILLLGVSLVFETQEAKIAGLAGFISDEQWKHYRLLVGIEETLEQIAASLLVYVHTGYALRKTG